VLGSLSLIRHEEAGAELYARLERPHAPWSIFSWPIDCTLMLGIWTTPREAILDFL
jgi:hypothetical protein